MHMHDTGATATPQLTRDFLKTISRSRAAILTVCVSMRFVVLVEQNTKDPRRNEPLKKTTTYNANNSEKGHGSSLITL